MAKTPQLQKMSNDDTQHVGVLRKITGWLGAKGRFCGVIWALGPLCIGLYVASGLFQTRVADRLQNIVFDQYQRWSPRPWNPDGPVRVILIDDESIARHGQWPWPHETFARLTSRLAGAGAAVVAFDIVFAEQDRLASSAILARLPPLPERDALQQAMDKKGLLGADTWAQTIATSRVVLGYVLTPNGNAEKIPSKWGVATAGDDPRRFLPWYPKAILPLPSLAAKALGLGSFNMAADQDLLVRRVPL
ncbi:MAG: CHASE2 domain-containing protein, partial [Beijerinckiaceae bacterium]|nr:CHASE2 domain-containing protein [Beijerinckiaceae bacterium]